MAKTSIIITGEESEVGKILRENSNRIKKGIISISDKREPRGKVEIENSTKELAIVEHKKEI